MRIALILVGAAVVAYFIAMGIRAHINQSGQSRGRKIK